MNIDGATLVDVRLMSRKSLSTLLGNRGAVMGNDFRLMERWVRMEFRSEETGKVFWIALVWAKIDCFPEGGLCIFLGNENESDLSWDWRPTEGDPLYVQREQEVGFQVCFDYALSNFAK